MPTPLLLILRAKTDVYLMKMRIKGFKFLLSLEEHSVYYLNAKTASVRLLLLDNWAL